MLVRIFQGSKPIAASTTPTRIESSTRQNATASGEPPRKRFRPSLRPAGKSLTSWAISNSSGDFDPIIGQGAGHGEPVKGRQSAYGILIRASTCPGLLKPQSPPPPLSASFPAFPAGRPPAAACPSASG